MFRNRKKQEELDDEPAFFENVAAPATEMIPQPKQEEVEKWKISRRSARRNPY